MALNVTYSNVLIFNVISREVLLKLSGKTKARRTSTELATMERCLLYSAYNHYYDTQMKRVCDNDPFFCVFILRLH